MDYVLGVDGGNTKTIALVARRDGLIVSSGRGGCGDIYGAGSPEAALRQIDGAVGAALRAAQVAAGELGAACFSLAGADWPEDFALLQAALEKRGLGRRIQVVNDAIGGLRAGLKDGIGVAVICGTGTATGARAPDGRVWWSSYWQLVSGAGDLGAQAVSAVLRAELGLDPPTTLTGRVLEFFGAATVEEVLHRMTGRGLPPVGVARLAPALLDEAAAGDPAARAIVVAHGSALGEYALAAARRVGLDRSPFMLSLSGGVLRHPAPQLREALIERVRAAVPGVQPVLSRLEPVAGAVLLALEAAGVTVDDALLERLAGSLPPASLFRTDDTRLRR